MDSRTLHLHRMRLSLVNHQDAPYKPIFNLFHFYGTIIGHPCALGQYDLDRSLLYNMYSSDRTLKFGVHLFKCIQYLGIVGACSATYWPFAQDMYSSGCQPFSSQGPPVSQELFQDTP